MKIVTIVGARPQFIKCAPVSRELRKEHEEILVHTGQHYSYNLSGVFFEELHIPAPDYNLGVGSNTHGKQTADILVKAEEVLIKEKPDLAMLYGDTNSTLAGALAASKLHIKIAHVEAGPRNYDRRTPEEVNRLMVDHVSDLLFCPTEAAVDNLRMEGIVDGVYNVGDVMADAMEYYRTIANGRGGIADDLGLKKGGYMVVTVHRPVNTDNRDNMASIIEALGESGKEIIFPVHPRTRKFLQNYGLLNKIPDNVRLIEPLSYLDMLKLMGGAEKIITDSGGMQKEAYMMGMPCITLRENTEWAETLEYGWNVLVGVDKGRILKAIHIKERLGKRRDLFHRGASKKIADIIREWREEGRLASSPALLSGPIQ